MATKELFDVERGRMVEVNYDPALEDAYLGIDVADAMRRVVEGIRAARRGVSYGRQAKGAQTEAVLAWAMVRDVEPDGLSEAITEAVARVVESARSFRVFEALVVPSMGMVSVVRTRDGIMVRAVVQDVIEEGRAIPVFRLDLCGRP